MADVLIRKQLSGFYVFLIKFAQIALDFGGGPVDCLLGRDVLALCLFAYDGPNGSYSLSF